MPDPIPFDDDLMPWRAWTPVELAAQMSDVRADDGRAVRWAVAGGWAIDLFVGRETRAHEDLEMVVPAQDVAAVLTAFSGQEWRWYVPTDGHLHALPSEAFEQSHQTWLWSVTHEVFRLDMFRDLHDGDTWICRRDPSLRRPWRDVVRHTADGVPYLTPEIVLLFKGKAARDKDVADLGHVLPLLSEEQRVWLRSSLAQVHPGHAWLSRLG